MERKFNFDKQAFFLDKKSGRIESGIVHEMWVNSKSTDYLLILKNKERQHLHENKLFATPELLAKDLVKDYNVRQIPVTSEEVDIISGTEAAYISGIDPYDAKSDEPSKSALWNHNKHIKVT